MNNSIIIVTISITIYLRVNPSFFLNGEVVFQTISSRIPRYDTIPCAPQENIVSETQISEYYDNNRSWYLEPTTSSYLVMKMEPHKYAYWLNCTYLVLQNIYVSRKFGLFYNNHYISYPDQILRESGPGKVIAAYDNIIVLGHWNSINFGHWVYDTLIPLMIIPKHIRDISYVIGSEGESMAIETLTILGFRREQILLFKNLEYLYGFRVHTIINPTTHVSHFSTAAVNLSRLLYQKLGLSTDPPKSYVLMNRRAGVNRHISNFDEFVSAVKEKFPQYPWTTFPDPFSSFREAAKHWSDICVLFSPTGSNLANLIFTKAGSAVCSAQGEKPGIPEISIATVLSIHFACFTVKDMRHDYGHGTNMEIKVALDTLGRAIYAQENGHFP